MTSREIANTLWNDAVRQLEEKDKELEAANDLIVILTNQVNQLKEQVEANNSVGTFANFLQKVIKEQAAEIQNYKKALTDCTYHAEEQAKLLNASADRSFQLNQELKNLTENYHNRLLDIDELQRTIKELRLKLSEFKGLFSQDGEVVED